MNVRDRNAAPPAAHSGKPLLRRYCKKRIAVAALICLVASASQLHAQSVCLPAPRLLTITPMGGQVGTTVEVTIAGDNFEDVEELIFSHPGITAVPVRNDAGVPVANRFTVNIAADCPAGIHEARTMTRLGVSSSRVFSVGTLPEVVQTAGNTSLEKAMTLTVNSLCNGAVTKQAVDYYSFEAQKDQRVVVDCAARGVDSKMYPVLVVADEKGNDLQVERRGGAVDFTAPADGTYVVKVHDLTFDGGPYHFYRLVLQSLEADQRIVRQPSTRSVSACSWPPEGLAAVAATTEAEAGGTAEEQAPQQVTLPCDISGRFYPAADVDQFEFAAKKGDVWWVEVASERLGRPTDPAVLVQQVIREGEQEKLVDVVELSDIDSPVKVSSNGYSYDGPPYNAGSPDVLGKVEIKEDGVYRLTLSDLLGGTRTDPDNIYRLIVRKAAPDFAIAAWALHMNLRNGDRNALSKPAALRGGATMPMEVVVIRRDGFDGAIDLQLEGLPEGVTATGLTIPAGKSRGILLLTAAENAPRGLTQARFIGRADINGQPVVRTGSMASMAWPVPNAWSEIPAPRLLADFPVSVCGSEKTPLTIAAAEDKAWEVTAGQSLTLPLHLTRRCEFSGKNMKLSTFGAGFEGHPAFEVNLDAETAETVVDTAKLKVAPGDYTIAFYGSAVAKYQYFPEGVEIAQQALNQAKKAADEAAAEVNRLAEVAKTVSEEQRTATAQAAADAVAQQKQAEAAVKAAESALKAAENRSKPTDIVDIVVSSPIRIRVNPVQESTP
ncbi:MAG: PPC domain-containing protein [Planctomycetaceae bacterium]|nr:PPC domain-containing protein [Planctomycetaceae bacterium]